MLDTCVFVSGYKCPNSMMSAPTACPTGTYQTATGQTSCDDCPAGSECTDPTTANQCAAGKYAALGSGVCTNCPTGNGCVIVYLILH